MTYSPRSICFKETISIKDWRVKCYTISKKDSFTATAAYASAIDSLAKWLTAENSVDSSHEHIAFLTVHEATEGVFACINWWVGQNMLNTEIYFKGHEESTAYRRISGDGLFACVWELEVIDFERKAWTEYFLKKLPEPELETYLDQTLTTSI